MKKTTSTKKILARQHTGKLRHHKHTSYGALALVLILAVMPVMYASRAVAYAATEGGGSYTTYAVVPGPTPKTAPTISNLTNGTIYRTSAPIRVVGSCPSDTLVKVFKNEVLAGAALCQNGSYQMQIDLFVGNNSLIARAYNTNDVVSPDSTTVSVQLLPPGTVLNGSDQLNVTGAPAGQFYLTSEIFHRGAAVGETMSWPLIVAGGQPPYAVSISWGDGQTDLLSRGDANRFDISHSYTAAAPKGGYTIIVKGTDQAGDQSYLQLVAIVSGGPATGIVGGVTGGYSHSTLIRTAWQLLAVSVIIVFSFWLGEQREVRLLRRLRYGATA